MDEVEVVGVVDHLEQSDGLPRVAAIQRHKIDYPDRLQPRGFHRREGVLKY